MSPSRSRYERKKHGDYPQNSPYITGNWGKRSKRLPEPNPDFTILVDVRETFSSDGSVYFKRTYRSNVEVKPFDPEPVPSSLIHR